MQKNIRHLKRKPKVGQFSLEENASRWYFCREQFSENFLNNHVGLFFAHKKDEFQNICDFIHKTEDVLTNAALLNIEKSKFTRTNLNFILWVEPSKFWMQCSMKRSLFTLLLRSSLDYNCHNYEKCLFNCSASTKLAIQRFMYGFTEFNDCDERKFKGLGKGWTDHFRNKNNFYVCKNLKMPNYLKKMELNFGKEVLWN